ncbi:Sensor histidine kinase ResE [Thermoflexales bacterium]|nr:Sensor histidine kinase ResE [Thermoflexales bacterium]
MKSRWRMKHHGLIVLLPIGIGMGLSLILNSGLFPTPIVYLRADVGALLVLIGILLSIGLAAWSSAWSRARKNVAREARWWAAEDRRRFVRRLDHELKNPLTAIRAGLANVTAADQTQPRREALRSVEAQVLRISRLTADLRKLAELETRTLEMSPVNLAEVLQQVVALTQEKSEADTRRLTLTLPQAPWPLPPVQGDRDLLLLALHNLIDNALKFTRPGDTIEVRASEDGSSVVIEVADTGPGIPEAELPHVWEELYRGERARGVPGSGLGLALVRAIIDQHRGHIIMRSLVNHGTVITLRLPVG